MANIYKAQKQPHASVNLDRKIKSPTVAPIQLFCVQTLKKPKATANWDFPDPSAPMQAEAA